MVENHLNHQGPLVDFPCAQSPEIIPIFPFAELTPKTPKTPKTPPRVYLQHEIRVAEKNDSRTSSELPLDFRYAPESPRSLCSSSTQSPKPENIKNECAMTDGALSGFGSLLGRSHCDNQDEDCFRNSERQKPWDPEKTHSDDVEAMSTRMSTTNSHHSIVTYTSDPGSRESGYAEDHTLRILVYLCFLSPLLTIAVSLHTILLTLILLLLSPFSVCSSFAPLSTQIHTYLFPPLKIQLSLIASAMDQVKTATTKPLMLILVLVFSPVCAIGIMVSAWVAALFWVYATIIGDPDGRDKRDGHDDGKAAVLGVRGWWERWLKLGLRFEQKQ